MDVVFFAQLVINGLIAGLVISLGALGITLVFGIARFANIAAGDMATIGAYFALYATLAIGSVVIGTVVAAALTGLVAVLLHWSIYRNLSGRSSIAFLVCSIGVAFMLRSAIGLAFGHSQQMFTVPLVRPFVFGDLRIGVLDLQIVALTVGSLLVAFATLKFTPIGREMRAVADNPDLARVSGINVDRVMAALWLMAGALAAIAGVATGLKAVVTPEIGWETLLPSFAAAILGGLGSPIGAVVAGIIIGVAQEVSTPFIGFSYKIALSFFVILAVLLMRPNGLFGERVLVR